MATTHRRHGHQNERESFLKSRSNTNHNDHDTSSPNSTRSSSSHDHINILSRSIDFDEPPRPSIFSKIVSNCSCCTLPKTLIAIVLGVCIVALLSSPGSKAQENFYQTIKKKNPLEHFLSTPTNPPTRSATLSRTKFPSTSPTRKPSDNPTKKPSDNPTKKPTQSPTKHYQGFKEAVGDNDGGDGIVAVRLDKYKDAKCLDGSPGMYYISKGSKKTGGKEKYFIYFEGGAWCGGIGEAITNENFESCYDRSKTYLGSTKNDPQNMNDSSNINYLKTSLNETDFFNHYRYGFGPYATYFSRDFDVNPLFHDWTVVYVRYCDGTSFSSNLDKPIKVSQSDDNGNENEDKHEDHTMEDLHVNSNESVHNDSSPERRRSNTHVRAETESTYLHFRGLKILDAVFSDLINEQRLKDASDIVIGGQSAGALAMYLHANYIYNNWFSGGYVRQKERSDDTEKEKEKEKAQGEELEAGDETRQEKKGLKTFMFLMEGGYFVSVDRDRNVSGDGIYDNFVIQKENINNTNVDNQHFNKAMKWIYETTNPGGLDQECLTNNKENPENCMYASYSLPFINSSITMFIFQSRFDSWQVRNILNVKIEKDNHDYDKLINDFGDHLYDSLLNKLHQRNVQSETVTNYGIFLDSCSHHVWCYDEFIIENDTEATSIYKFWVNRFGGKDDTNKDLHKQYQNEWLQKKTFPCHECCHF